MHYKNVLFWLFKNISKISLKMDQLSKMNKKIDDSENMEALEMKKTGKTKPGLRKVKSVESGLGSLCHEVRV